MLIYLPLSNPSTFFNEPGPDTVMQSRVWKWMGTTTTALVKRDKTIVLNIQKLQLSSKVPLNKPPHN